MKKRSIIALTAVAVFISLGLWLGAGLGQWLIVEEPLEKADAIVVFGGMLPFRSMEAAALYRQGWAPEIWLPALEPSASFEYTKNLGLDPHDPKISLQVLDREMVPSPAIRVLSENVRNTREEVQLALSVLRQRKGKRLILVTSPAHTRRVKALWNRMKQDGEESVIRYTSIDRYQPAGWWKRESDFNRVKHEVAGLVGVFLGL